MCARVLTTWPRGYTQSNEEKKKGERQAQTPQRDTYTQASALARHDEFFLSAHDGETLKSFLKSN